MHSRVPVLVLILAVFGCAELNANQTGSFPFEFSDGLIWVKVSVAGSTLNFVLDSGAGSTVLSLQAARRLSLKTSSPVRVQMVDGSTTGYRIAQFQGSVGGIPLKKEIITLDLSTTDKLCCRPIDGLIGQDFFRGRVVQIDFKNRCVCVSESSETLDCCTVLPMSRRNDALCIPVGFNGQKPQWARLDTGCISALEWAGALGKKESGSMSVGLADATQSSVSAEVRLGTECIRNVQTGIHRKQIFPSEAGLLGNGLLSKYRVTIDSRKMQVLLEKP